MISVTSITKKLIENLPKSCSGRLGIWFLVQSKLLEICRQHVVQSNVNKHGQQRILIIYLFKQTDLVIPKISKVNKQVLTGQ